MTLIPKVWARSLIGALSSVPSSNCHWSKSLIANTGIAALSRVFNALGGLAALGLLSRFLPLPSFGQYALLLAYGSILQIVADFGLYLTLTRLLAASPMRATHYLSEALSLRLALFFLAFISGFLLTGLVPAWQGLRLPFLLASVGFLAQSFSQLTIGVFQYHAVIWRASLGDIIGRLVQLLFLSSLFVLQPTLGWAVTSFSIGLVVAAFVHYLLLPAGLRPSLAFHWSAWRELIVSSWPLGLLLLLNVIYFKIDTLILSFFRTTAEVGYYGLAYRLVESSLFLPAVFGGLLLPRLSAAWQPSKPFLFARYYTQALPLVLWVATGCALILGFFAPAVIHVIAGSGYLPSVILLRILSLSLFLMFLGNVTGFGLVAAGKQRTLLILSLVLTAFNLLANLLFIPAYGTLAAAWTTVVTETLAAAASLYLLWRLCSPRLSLAFGARILSLIALNLLAFSVIPPFWPAVIQLLLAVSLYLLLSVIVRPLPLSTLDLLLKKITA